MRFPESRIRSDINVTPLVDVCLVLLIIFMVVTPMLGKDESVVIPETPAPLPIPEKPEQVVVSVRVGGAIFFKGRQVSDGELLQVLRDLHAAGVDRPVMVRGDRQVPYRHVRAVLRIIHEAGFARAALITQRQEV